jgi:DNA polymerase elongation subunit (family B)
VLEPKRGFYHEHPVATLDYSGLYPSIMMAYNLCPTTLCTPEMADELNRRVPGSCVQCRATGAWFVVVTLSKGVTPRILEGLTAARKLAKTRMAECKKNGDTDGYNAFDVRQLAIKVIANSVYGFFGVLMGRFGYPIVAATVTAYGRMAIDVAKSTAESEETRALMRAHGIQDTRLTVLYGVRVRACVCMCKLSVHVSYRPTCAHRTPTRSWCTLRRSAARPTWPSQCAWRTTWLR